LSGLENPHVSLSFQYWRGKSETRTRSFGQRVTSRLSSTCAQSHIGRDSGLYRKSWRLDLSSFGVVLSPANGASSPISSRCIKNTTAEAYINQNSIIKYRLIYIGGSLH
jgi:hypothetical protein